MTLKLGVGLLKVIESVTIR